MSKTKSKRIVKRILKRSLSYMMKGYAFASIPFIFIGYASNIYYQLIVNFDFLQKLFPTFENFLFTVLIPIIISSGLLGYAYFKKLWFFKADTEIQQEANDQNVINTYLGMESTLQILKKLNITPTPNFLKRLNYWKDLFEKIEW